jgi:hypothetical protein
LLPYNFALKTRQKTAQNIEAGRLSCTVLTLYVDQFAATTLKGNRSPEWRVIKAECEVLYLQHILTLKFEVQ